MLIVTWGTGRPWDPRVALGWVWHCPAVGLALRPWGTAHLWSKEIRQKWEHGARPTSVIAPASSKAIDVLINLFMTPRRKQRKDQWLQLAELWGHC